MVPPGESVSASGDGTQLCRTELISLARLILTSDFISPQIDDWSKARFGGGNWFQYLPLKALNEKNKDCVLREQHSL